MNYITLLDKTDNVRVDEVLRSVVGIFELSFPSRIRGYFLVGSYAIGKPVAASDLDLVLLFKDNFMVNEAQRAKQLGDYCNHISTLTIDFALYTEEQVLQQQRYGGGFAFTRRLVYGKEPKGEIPPPPFEQYTWNIMNGTFQVITAVRSEMDDLSFPLKYPNQKGKFYGYECPIHLPDGSICDGARQLVNNVCLAASAIVAYKARRYVGSKYESIKAYQECINDEWTDLITKIYETGRNKWGYIIPHNDVAQDKFRELCKRTLKFEIHFLLVYQDYLRHLTKSDAPEEMRLAAEGKLQNLFAAQYTGKLKL